LIFWAHGTYVLDPGKWPALCQQMLNALAAPGHLFPQERKRELNRTGKGGEPMLCDPEAAKKPLAANPNAGVMLPNPSEFDPSNLDIS